jgi:hypothetical protein
MGKTYAETLPLPVMAGGPNEGIGYFADGLDTDPPLETHKNDLNLLNHHVSRLDALRHLAKSRAVRIVAAVALTLPAAACAGQEGNTEGRGGGAVAESTLPADGEAAGGQECLQFERLSPADQQECRELIAGMETADINQLSPLDQARWASYYRHVALGEKSVLHTVIRANILEQPSGAESMALRFITDYQNSVFTLAWHIRNKPEVGNDPRTARALLGSDDPASEGFRAAQAAASGATGLSLAEFMQAASQSSPVFSSLFPDNPGIKKDGSDYVVSFTTKTIAANGTVKPQLFTYRLLPYMDALPDSTGTVKEQPDDPNDPLNAISAALGRPHLASTPQIRDATA